MRNISSPKGMCSESSELTSLKLCEESDSILLTTQDADIVVMED